MEIKRNSTGDNSVIVGDGDSTKFRIGDSSQSIIIDSLINLYEDPIGSIVREITSNCFDANRERNLILDKEKAPEAEDDINWFSDKQFVEIEFLNNFRTTSTNTQAIVFRDFGIGLSEDRVKNIFTVFGNSSKRDNNIEIGGFGLGAKSPFAYTSSFYVITNYNGKKITYLLSRNDDFPTMEKVHETNTTELNGAEVLIPVKSVDVTTFFEKIKSQLLYFNNIEYKNIPADYITQKKLLYEDSNCIIEAPNKSYYSYDEISVLVGKINYRVLKHLMPKIYHNCFNIPLKLKFNIGELDLVPSREALRFSEHTIKKLEDKYKAISKTFNSIIENYLKSEKDFLDLLAMMLNLSSNHNSSLASYQENNHTLYLYNIMAVFLNFTTNTQFTYKDIKINLSKIKDLFAGMEFFNISSGRKSISYRKLNSWSFNSMVNADELFYCGSNFSTSKSKQKLIDDPASFYAFKYYTYNFTDLSKKVFDYMINNSKRVKNYDSLPDSSTISLGNKSNPALVRKKMNLIFFKQLEFNSYYYGYKNTEAFNFTQKEKKLNNIDMTKVIYGNEEDSDDLKEYAAILKQLKSLNRYNLLKIAKTLNKDFKNAMYIKDLFHENNEHFIKFITTTAITPTISEYRYLENFKFIYEEMYDKYIKILQYKNQTESLRDSSKQFILLKTNKTTKTESDLYDLGIIKEEQAIIQYTKDLDILPYIQFHYWANDANHKLINELKSYLNFKNKKVD
jgi:hypothetical protein